MPNMSFQVDQETKDQFERAITAAKSDGAIPHNSNKSDVLRMLADDFIEEYRSGDPEENAETGGMSSN